MAKGNQSNIKGNTIYNFIRTFFSIVFPLITFPYVSRVLLPENIGKINFAVSVVNYFALIASLGISTHAVRECAMVKNDRNKLSNMASQLFSINLITTLIAYVALVITLVFFRRFDSYRTLIIINSTVVLFTTLGADWLNTAMEDLKFITIRTISFQLVSLLLMFLFINDTGDYHKYAVISVFSSSGSNIVNIAYRKKYCRVRFTTQIDWSRHIGPIMTLFAMSLSQVIFSNVDITMLGLMWDDYQVGIYGTAHKVSSIVSQVVASVGLVILPRLSYYFSVNDFDNINKLLRKMLSLNIALGLPCVTGVIMLSKDIIYMVGGEEYGEAASVLCLLMLTILFALVGGNFLGNAILLPSKQEKYYMVICFITAVINVILNYILIPMFAANGAAMATAANGLLILIFLALKVDKRICIDRIGGVFGAPIVGCGLIAVICCLFSYVDNIWVRVVLSVSTSVIVYLIVLLLLRYDLLTETLSEVKGKLTAKTKR